MVNNCTAAFRYMKIGLFLLCNVLINSNYYCIEWVSKTLSLVYVLTFRLAIITEVNYINRLFNSTILLIKGIVLHISLHLYNLCSKYFAVKVSTVWTCNIPFVVLHYVHVFLVLCANAWTKRKENVTVSLRIFCYII